MTTINLAEIEARHAAATKGPWAASNNAAELWGPLIYTYVHDGIPRFKRLADAKFIAASWQDISDLLALVKEQAAKLAEANAGLDQFAADIVGLREELDAEFARNKEQAAEIERLREMLDNVRFHPERIPTQQMDW